MQSEINNELDFKNEEERNDFLKTRIEFLGLSEQTKNTLLKVSIRTVGGLIRKTEASLVNIRGLGRQGIDEIQSALKHIFHVNISVQQALSEMTPVSETLREEYIKIKTKEQFGDDNIVDTLSKQLGFDEEAIRGHTRNLEIVRVRDIVVYLLREYGGMSYPGIGRLIDRDHTTIIHAYTKLKDRFAKDPELEKELIPLISNVKAIKERKIRVETDLIPNILASMKQGTDKVRIVTPKVIPERNIKILDLYREGLTLQNIASVVGITRERVRQVVISTIKQNAINESIKKGIVMDSEILAEEEAKKRKAVQDAKKPIKLQVKKEKRWSRYFLACRSCGTTVVPHVRNGYCENCIGSYRGERRDEVINRHGGKCDICQIDRGEAIRKYGRDFYITKDQKVLCRRHFLEMSGRILGKSRRDRLSQ